MIFQTLIIFTLLIIIPTSSIIFKKQYMDKSLIYNRKVHYIFTIFLTFFMTTLVLLSLKLDKISFNKIGLNGLKYNQNTILISAAMFLLSTLVIIINYKSALILKKVINNKLMPSGNLNELKKILPQKQSDKIYFMLIAFSSGICEEIIYRGFLTHYISNITHLNDILIVIIISLIFALAHVSQGMTGAINTFILSILWTSLYFSTGSLLFPIIFHIIYDLKMCLYPLLDKIEIEN